MQIPQISVSENHGSNGRTIVLRKGQERISFDPDSPTSITNALKALGARGTEDALSLIDCIQTGVYKELG